jgi:uncharacterized membrane protein
MRRRPTTACVGEPAGDRGDRGMVTAFVVVFSTALLLIAGLVVDGGRMLAEHRRVDNLADSAARAGAQAISEDRVRNGDEYVLDVDAARAAACDFLSGTGYPCSGGSSASAVGNTVNVTVTGSIGLLLLPGGTKTVSSEGTACVAIGIAAGTC